MTEPTPSRYRASDGESFPVAKPSAGWNGGWYGRWYRLLIPVLFLLIYHQVFTAEYVYLDEAPQIYDKTGDQVYRMFMGQGRPFTAWITQMGFNMAWDIDGLKWLRIVSFSGWIMTTLISSVLFARWSRMFGWDARLRMLCDIFMTASLSVCIYIGWASCFEIFIAMLAGLLSGECMLRYLYGEPGGRARMASLIAGVLLALLSLFTYQSAFGMFLLPFVLIYATSGVSRPGKQLRNAVLFYLSMYALYYLLFKLSIPYTGIPMSDRAGFTTAPFSKLGFFFSGPLPSAFSLNLLYSSGILPVQLFQYAVMAAWLILLWRASKEPAAQSRIIRIILLLLLLALTYLPSMIAKENFASYRSLFPLALTVFLSVASLLTSVKTSPGWKNGCTAALGILVIGSGSYSYNLHFVDPLVREYAWYEQQMNRVSSPEKVLLVRAERNLFRQRYGLRPIKDEFGCPSTSRDWVPEPLIQELARRAFGYKPMPMITVIQYEPADTARVATLRDSLQAATGKVLFLNINEALK